MPYLDAYTGELLIAGVTILWGIFVESWYVSRWTIFFNVIPLIVMLMTLTLGDFEQPLMWYTGIAAFLTLVTGRQSIKQLVGAKSYGTLTLVMTMYSAGQLAGDQVFGMWILYSLGVYALWFLVVLIKYKIQEANRRPRYSYY